MRRFGKAQYWNCSTLGGDDQIRAQLEFIVIRSAIADKNESTASWMHCAYPDKQGLFTPNDHRYTAYYNDTVQCLLTGHFMNVAVQGLS